MASWAGLANPLAGRTSNIEAALSIGNTQPCLSSFLKRALLEC
jgi:hypothetical protein